MSKLFRSILYFSGYGSGFDKNTEEPPFDIEAGRGNTYVARAKSEKKDKKRIYSMYLYNIVIFLFMSWSVPYSLYYSIKNGDILYLGRSSFQIMFCLQYYFGIRYFEKEHFHKNIACNTKLMEILNMMLPISGIIGIGIIITNIILLVLNFNMHIYSEIYQNADLVGKIFTVMLLFFDYLYSYQSFLINACVFIINMVYHKDFVSEYSEKLGGEYIKKSINAVKKINLVAIEFSQMRESFDSTVSHLGPFFTWLNFFGFLGIYCHIVAYQNNVMTYSELINGVLFLLIEIIYIISIQAVRKHINNISASITSHSFITTFFGNKQFERNIPMIGADGRRISSSDDNARYTVGHGVNLGNNITSAEMYSVQVQTLAAGISSDETLDWIVLQGLTLQQWDTFKFFGVEITDSLIIQRIFGIIFAVLISKELGDILNYW